MPVTFLASVHHYYQNILLVDRDTHVRILHRAVVYRTVVERGPLTITDRWPKFRRLNHWSVIWCTPITITGWWPKFLTLKLQLSDIDIVCVQTWSSNNVSHVRWFHAKSSMRVGIGLVYRPTQHIMGNFGDNQQCKSNRLISINQKFSTESTTSTKLKQ